jgi:hypothetical protein
MAADTELKTCLFLKLPPELRNRIYELVLVEEKPIQISTWAQSQKPCRPSWCDLMHTLDGQLIAHLREPSVLEVCKQIRTEGLPIFYGQNVFFGDTPDSHRWVEWLAQLGPKKRAMVKNMQLTCPYERTWDYQHVNGHVPGSVTPVLAETLEDVRHSLGAHGLDISDGVFQFELYWPLSGGEEWRLDKTGNWKQVRDNMAR